MLFARTTRSTRLARAGKLFLEHVPRVFTVLRQARDSVATAANRFHSQLRVALSDGITPSRLSSLLAQCRQEEPEVEIRLFEVPLLQQIKGLQDDLYDIGLGKGAADILSDLHKGPWHCFLTASVTEMPGGSGTAPAVLRRGGVDCAYA